MDQEQYRERLTALERQLAGRLDAVRDVGSAPTADLVEPGDQSQMSEIKDEYLATGDTDSRVLAEVREALERIDDGTYGRCQVDGEPIEEQRLAAVPWTRYCRLHQQEIEPPLPDTRAL